MEYAIGTSIKVFYLFNSIAFLPRYVVLAMVDQLSLHIDLKPSPGIQSFQYSRKSINLHTQ